jgi:hypothetical protein
MKGSWREFIRWKCESCGESNIIVESTSEQMDKAAMFERSCSVCGVTAPGATIRPVHTAYRITTPHAFYPSRFADWS